MFGPTTGSTLFSSRPRRLARLRNFALATALGLTAGLLPAASAFAESGPGSAGNGRLGGGAQTAVTAPRRQRRPRCRWTRPWPPLQEAAGGPGGGGADRGDHRELPGPGDREPVHRVRRLSRLRARPVRRLRERGSPRLDSRGWRQLWCATRRGTALCGCRPEAQATSPAMCIDLNYPTMRYFVRDARPTTGRASRRRSCTWTTRPPTRRTRSGSSAPQENWRLTEDIEIEPERGGVDAGLAPGRLPPGRRPGTRATSGSTTSTSIPGCGGAGGSFR